MPNVANTCCFSFLELIGRKKIKDKATTTRWSNLCSRNDATRKKINQRDVTCVTTDAQCVTADCNIQGTTINETTTCNAQCVTTSVTTDVQPVGGSSCPTDQPPLYYWSIQLFGTSLITSKPDGRRAHQMWFNHSTETDLTSPLQNDQTCRHMWHRAISRYKETWQPRGEAAEVCHLMWRAGLSNGRRPFPRSAAHWRQGSHIN